MADKKHMFMSSDEDEEVNPIEQQKTPNEPSTSTPQKKLSLFEKPKPPWMKGAEDPSWMEKSSSSKEIPLEFFTQLNFSKDKCDEKKMCGISIENMFSESSE